MMSMNSPRASPFATSTDEKSRPRPDRQPSHLRPAVAPSPGGYTQNTTNDNYFPAQAANIHSGMQDAVVAGAVTDGMAAMAVAPSTGATRKKKDRHAYHQLDQALQNHSHGLAAVPPAHEQPNVAQSAGPWLQHNPPTSTQPWQPQQQSSSVNHGQFPSTGAPIAMNPSGMAHGASGSGPQNRVNPDQVPGVPLSRDLSADYYQTHVYATMEQHVPPPATTPYVSYDQGNASPKYARLTLNCVPNTHEQLQATALPLGLVVQPLAKQADGEQAVPVLDFGDAGPPRCRRCRAYINPFMIFSNGGSRMTCNLCGHPNEVSSDYFAPTDPSGVRVDRMQRPELLLGTCEFLVPKEYWSKEPVPMRFLFLLDVSAEAYNRGFLQAMCDGILESLYGTEHESESESEATVTRTTTGARVGFMTYNREIHFYNVAGSNKGPQQLVMSDVEEPFSPISPDHFFVDPSECRENITSLLKQIPGMFALRSDGHAVLYPSLQAALSVLEASGGKVLCSLASLPTHGPGKLQQRDKGQAQNDDGDHGKDLLKTENPHFRKLQADLVKAGIGIDFFLSAPIGGYLDVATIGLVAEKSGGETFYYPNWSYPRDTLRLRKELEHSIRREQGHGALMKVRCSNGLQLANYNGNFTQHTFGADLELASVTEDSSFCVTFAYDGKLDAKTDAHFQSALLYTTTSGQRRVRCSNVVASVTENARESMRFVDQDAIISVITKESVAKVGERSLKDIRQAVQDKTTDILAGYRKNFSGSHPPGQLVLPENLKEFSMYMLGLVKSRALKGGREPIDRRIHEVRMIKSMGPAELSLYLYPRIIALHNLEPSEGFANEHGHLKFPRSVRASFSQIEEGGAYLVDNGQLLLLWLHQQVSPNLLGDLFGEGKDTLQSLDPNMTALPVLDSLLNAQVRNILLHLESQRGSKGLALQLARQGLDGAEFEFARLLYEDRNGEASSYVDWLVMLHRSVGMELSGQRSKNGEEVSSTISNTITSITGSIGL